ncbi:MAG TPA: hypothetical protein PLV08_00365 [Flavobacteriales bacterium]|jgi:hypothetical protein|nr:hypothetical protein [Flavobacteriales bacterium]MBK7102522.1 hypothetical protein [Flavobacteriales bacterium]MBK7113255.1 hypothetical protein [Flavobacteriales bacterium]MBK7619498.1 hypothetical protein [Flavobacteriales bacterium]MBK8530621.1 hypothetical protein [Flavobacteriales bacterium]
MRLLRTYFTLVLLAAGSMVVAQLSPGDLTTAHAALEGMSNCTQCHDLGNKVTNAKCLECHKEIKSLITKKRGYHASSVVKAQDCFACHSEHHGRKFEMVRFDEKAFDHALTGYKLEGGHKPVDCRKCHVPDNIADRELKKRPLTFLGLEQACLSCHDDFHQGTMSGECTKCHNMNEFRPASKFDHGKTDFKLAGKHVNVDCKKCHETTTRQGKEFQRFADVPHADCKACHNDPHAAHFNNACAQCHTEVGFNIFSGKNRFDHNTTNFKLNGKHKTTDCFTCHQKTSDPLRVFQDRVGVTVNQCATCHEDAHDGKFGNDCAKCHQETGFRSLKSMDFFDHAVTDFPLQGKHVDVDCKKCHKGSFTGAMEFSKCSSCHEDYHKGEFAKNDVTPDCAECHSVLDGFEMSMYTLEQHRSTKFPLEGAHIATPCTACHMKDEKNWTFRELGHACFDCHDNVHGDDLAENGVTDCKRCHVAENWFPSKFDHDFTEFPLVGEHVKVDCKECHLKDPNAEVLSFKVESFECADCHK